MPYPETVKYIKKQIDKGVSAERIKKGLLDSGYQQEIVNKLLEKAGVEKENKKEEGIEKILLKDIAIGAVLLLFVGSLIYINFFTDEEIGVGTKKVFFSKPTQEGFYLDFSDSNPLELEKNNQMTIELGEYVNEGEYDLNEIIWSYSGKVCINVKVADDGVTANLKSVFLPGCPEEENIVFTVESSDGQSAFDTLQVKII